MESATSAEQIIGLDEHRGREREPPVDVLRISGVESRLFGIWDGNSVFEEDLEEEGEEEEERRTTELRTIGIVSWKYYSILRSCVMISLRFGHLALVLVWYLNSHFS